MWYGLAHSSMGANVKNESLANEYRKMACASAGIACKPYKAAKPTPIKKRKVGANLKARLQVEHRAAVVVKRQRTRQTQFLVLPIVVLVCFVVFLGALSGWSLALLGDGAIGIGVIAGWYMLLERVSAAKYGRKGKSC